VAVLLDFLFLVFGLDEEEMYEKRNWSVAAIPLYCKVTVVDSFLFCSVTVESHVG
jgi:hypothetical protein